MITEKTVELNLTAELLNFLWGKTKRTHFVIAPSQRAEADLGFDAAFHGAGPGLLIQFKRAHVSGSVWTWRLNRTAAEDQHLRLQALQFLGYPVLYALPLFATPHSVETGRLRLLAQTAWIRPLDLQPPGGPTGPHDVTLDQSTGIWKVASPDPIRIETPSNDPAQIVAELDRQSARVDLTALVGAANAVVFRGEIPPDMPGAIPEERRGVDATAGDGLCIFGQVPTTV